MELRFYKVEQAAKILNTKTSTVRTYCREGKIPALKVGRGYRIAKEDLEKWLRLQKQDSTSFDEEHQKLLEAEAKYKDLFENASDGIILFDIKGLLILANPKAYEMSGYTHKEAEGMHFARFIHPEDLPLATERFMSRMAGEDVQSEYEVRYLRKDGQVIHVEISSSVVTKEGKPSGIQIILRDMSERKKAEEALRESEEEYRKIFESTEEAIITTDSDSKILAANPAAAKMLDYDNPSELMGMSSIKLYVDKKQREPLFRKLKDKGHVKNYELTFKKKDGTLVNVLGSATIHRDEKGNLLRVEGMFMDITERKKAEEALAVSEARHRSLVENSLEGIGISKGNQVVYANEALLDIFGYKTLDELSKVSLLDHVAPKSRDMIQKKMEQRTKGASGVSRYQYSIVRKDGEIRDLEISSYEITIDGETHTQATFRDITERKKAEEALQKSEEKWRSLIENAPNTIIIVDRSGVITFVNRTVAGLALKDVIGKSHYGFIESKYQKVAKDVIEQVIETGQPGSYEIKGTGPRGRTSWYETQVGPIRQHGQITSVMLIATDVTKHKQEEKKED